MLSDPLTAAQVQQALDDLQGQIEAAVAATYPPAANLNSIINDAIDNQQINAVTPAQVAQLILEADPAYGQDGLWLRFTYASAAWDLQCPPNSPGIEIADGIPYWMLVAQAKPLEAATKLKSQRAFETRVFREGCRFTICRREYQWDKHTADWVVSSETTKTF